MPKNPSTKVLKTCRIEKQYIEYCTMQHINFNKLVNTLLHEAITHAQRNDICNELLRVGDYEIRMSIHEPL